MEEVTEHIKSFYERIGQWILMLVVALAVGLLWLSWRNGWFPFGTASFMTPAVTTPPQPTQEDILQSLTAPAAPTSSPAAVLKQLTPPKSSKTIQTNPIDTTSVLDSLTPKK